MIARLFIVDNNCLNALGPAANRDRLARSLRAAQWEFWPTASNVLEAVNTSDPERRVRLGETLSARAGDCHSLPLAPSVLEAIARARFGDSARIEIGEAKLTALFRTPRDISDDQLAVIREHLKAQEATFDRAHEESQGELRDQLVAGGGRERSPTVGQFLDELWTTESHLGSYVERLWDQWELPSPVPVEDLLGNPAWRLYFEGWGAALYARVLQHPQPKWVEGSDLEQLTYLGMAPAAMMATNDRGFRDMANAVLRRRYPRRQVVPLSGVT